MKKILGFSCLLVVVIVIGLLLASSQTEEAQWLTGLVSVFGGIMLVGALSHDVVQGEVVDFSRLDPPTAFSAGSIRFTYADDSGNLHEEFRRVMQSTDKFQKLEIGDSVEVWVCKNDRSIVKLVGYGTHEPKSCTEKRDD